MAKKQTDEAEQGQVERDQEPTRDLKKQVSGSNLYKVGAVGPKGQVILRNPCVEGDEVFLMPDEAKRYQEHGVPLTRVDLSERAEGI